MGQNKEIKVRENGDKTSLGTIWEIPDDMWARIEPILRKAYPPAATGRPQIDFRAAINGIIFRMRSGCQWNQLPKRFGDDSSVHRWFQRWVGDGIFEKVWAVLLSECEDLGGVDWQWQAADSVMGKSRFNGQKRGTIRQIGGRWEPRRAFSSKQMVARLVS